MKLNILLLFVTWSFLLPNQHLSAQTIVSGIIRDADGNILPSANATLVYSTDTSLVQGTLTNETGKYSFDNITKGKYQIMVSYAGMKPFCTEPFDISGDKTEIEQPIIYLQKKEGQLKDVTVVARKPLYEQKIDRMIIHVKNSITNTGGTALDVLGKSPGVKVNRQDNSVAIIGKTGVVVMINGKINYMPPEAVFQMLATISSENIEKIEVITTPPSKYDAEGNAGYINIVLLNNPDSGLNGSYFITAGYGKRVLGDGGFNINYRNTKLSLTGNYSFTHGHYLQPSTALTKFTRGSDTITNTSYSGRDARRDVHDLRMEFEYHQDTANVFGLIIGANLSNWAMDAYNGASVIKNKVTDTTIKTYNSEINNWKNILSNLNFQHIFKAGKVLSAEANYIYYENSNPNTYLNQYYNNSKELINTEYLRSSKITPIGIAVVSTDYITPLNGKIILEAGGKYSDSKFSNGVELVKLKQDIYVKDTSHSANYILKENIAAAYASCTINPGHKISIKAGLRFELTKSDLRANNKVTLVNRKYGEFFPTLYFSKIINGQQNISLSYSRRITRPSFTDLAPFSIFFDPKTYFSGNAALQPAIANSIQAGYSLKQFNITLSYTYEQNTIESFYFQTQKIDTLTNILYLSASNFNYEKFLTANFSLPVNLNKWWSMQNNFILNYKQINTKNETGPTLLNTSDFNVTTTQHLILPKNLSFEITGSYYSQSYFGTTKFKPIYEVNAGLQLKSSNNKDMVRLTGNDIFNSGGNLRFTDNSIKGSEVMRNFNFGLVAYKLTYTHNFGNKSLKEKKERTTRAEEELNRVHH